MIRVVVVGQPFWGSRIATALNGRADDLTAVFVDQRSYPRLLARPPRAEHVVIMRAGYRIGATAPRGRMFDAYWSALRRAVPSAVACHYWLGTDVLDTVTEARAGTLRLAAVAAARGELHVADAPWLVTELAEVGIQAVEVHVPQPYHCPAIPPPLPSTFRVLTYLPGDRLEFYGGDVILDAARQLPDVAFDVVGRLGATQPEPVRNVAWHGWVSGMNSMYARAAVIVRIPRHDGLGAMVVEGLMNGRHVIYTHDLPFATRLDPVTAPGLVAELVRLRELHRGGSLELNLEGRAFASSAYDEQALAERLVAHIRARL